MKTVLNTFLCLQLFYIRHVYSTMSINCLQTLNTSDCNETPTKVFSYYKPGSRCELEVWRGCPTGNKFDTERECSDSCIFRDVEFDNKVKHKLNAKCKAKEDLNNCNEKIIHGFKYNELLMDCVEVATNCLGNIFEEKLDCIESCVRDLTWEEKLKLISAQQSRELDAILKAFANETAEHKEHSNTTDSGETKTTNVDNTDNDVNKTTAVTDGGKKLKGDETSTQSYEHNTGSNSTSANNEIGSTGTGGTSVSVDNNSNTTSNSESVKETTGQNIVTTMNAGTQTAA